MKKPKKKKQIPRIKFLLKVVILLVMLTIPSTDLVGVDVAIFIENEVFDKDLGNKSSTRYKTLEQQVEKEVKKGGMNIESVSCILERGTTRKGSSR